MRIGELFAGYGGLGMGVQATLGGEIAWVSEIDPGACKILAHRFPDVPNHGDITTIDWSAVEPVDVLTGGSPCQDLSAAGKRAGMTEGTRSNLWVSMREAIAQLRPGLVVWENVRGALSAKASSDMELAEGRVGDGDDGPVLRALGRVLGDLADLGYDASWQVLRASDVGAPHARARVFLIAWPVADAFGGGRDGWARATGRGSVERTAAGRDRGAAAPHAANDGRAWAGCAWHGRSGSADHGHAAADTEGQRRGEGRPESARVVGGSDDLLGGASDDRCETCGDRTDFHDADGFCAGSCGGSCADPQLGRPAIAAHANRDGLEGVRRLKPVRRDADGRSGADIAWGDYEPAIRRWERVTRPAPAPTEPNKKGDPRLSPRFVEWLMGLPAGWVTDVPGLSRNDHLKALGNGVVPQQAAEALRLLLPDVEAVAA